MRLYDLSKTERNKLVQKIESDTLSNLKKVQQENMLKYFSDEDTYLRKTGYSGIGKL